jgi:hypothetical protein
MKSCLLLVLALIAVGCGDDASSSAPATPPATNDTGAFVDAASTDTAPVTTDTAEAVDTAPCTACAALVGKVSRKAGTKPSAGG